MMTSLMASNATVLLFEFNICLGNVFFNKEQFVCV